jgi:hypothetical protein
MSRPLKLSLAALAVLAAMTTVPTLAGATVYCVDAAGSLKTAKGIDPSCETAQTSIGAALNAAAAHAGEDTVLVGPGSYTLPAKPGGGAEVEYENTNAGNLLHLRGIERPHLTLGSTLDNQTGIKVEATAGSTVEGLRLTIPPNADGTSDRAITLGGLGGVVGRDLFVDGPNATNAVGVALTAEGRLSRSTVDLPRDGVDANAAVSASSGNANIDTSTLRASEALRASASIYKVERSTLVGNRGVTIDSGTIELLDSLIELDPAEGLFGVELANYNPGSAALHAVVDGTTIVGGNSATKGIRVQADNGTETADATITDTILANEGVPLEVRADNGRTAKATVSYSAYELADVVQTGDIDGTGAKGLAELSQGGIVLGDPGFVDAAAGDYRLAPTSQLLDAGDPAAVPGGALDLAGSPRAVSATACPVAAGRQDIGAYELVPNCPPPGGEVGGGSTGGAANGGDGGSGGGADPGPPAQQPPASRKAPRTTISGKHLVTASGKRGKVVLTLGADQSGASFRCSVDGKAFKPCRARFVLHLPPGKHTVKVVATTAGLADPTPAKLVVRVAAAP